MYSIRFSTWRYVHPRAPICSAHWRVSLITVHVTKSSKSGMDMALLVFVGKNRQQIPLVLRETVNRINWRTNMWHPEAHATATCKRHANLLLLNLLSPRCFDYLWSGAMLFLYGFSCCIFMFLLTHVWGLRGLPYFDCPPLSQTLLSKIQHGAENDRIIEEEIFYILLRSSLGSFILNFKGVATVKWAKSAITAGCKKVRWKRWFWWRLPGCLHGNLAKNAFLVCVFDFWPLSPVQKAG